MCFFRTEWLQDQAGQELPSIQIKKQTIHTEGTMTAEERLPKAHHCVLSILDKNSVFFVCFADLNVLWEHIPLLQPIAFKIPAHLSMVSDTPKAVVKRVPTLMLPAPASSC